MVKSPPLPRASAFCRGLSLALAVEGISANSNGVMALGVLFADPDAEALRVKFNELLLALRR